MNEISLITKENIEILKNKKGSFDSIYYKILSPLVLFGSTVSDCIFSFILIRHMEIILHPVSLVVSSILYLIIFIILSLFVGFIYGLIGQVINNKFTLKSKEFFVEIEEYVQDTLKIEDATFDELKVLLSRQKLFVDSTSFIDENYKDKALDDLSLAGVHLSNLLLKNKVFNNYALLAFSHPIGKRYQTVLKNMFDFLYTENINFKNITGDYLYQSDVSFQEGNEIYFEKIDIFKGQRIKLEVERKDFRCIYIQNILKLSYYEFYLSHKEEIMQTKYNILKLVPILEERQSINFENKEDLINKLFFSDR